MSPASLPSTLFEKTARWFERAKAALVGDLPCRRGCAHCCVGLFSVTMLDRDEIQQGLRLLSHGQRQAIEQTAALQASMILASAPQLADDLFIDCWPDGELDRLAEQFSKLPCPALGSDGSCGLYAFRPLACRSMGIPVEIEGVVHGVCGIQSYVPVVRLTRSLRREETFLADAEAGELARLRDQLGTKGEELWLPFAFVPDTVETPLGRMA